MWRWDEYFMPFSCHLGYIFIFFLYGKYVKLGLFSCSKSGWNSHLFTFQISPKKKKFRLDFHMIFMCLNIHDFHMKSTLVVYRGGASFQKHPRGFEQRRKNWFAIKHKCTLMYWVLSVISYKGIEANGKVIQVLIQHFRTAALVLMAR